jgi:hypothetical protein
VVYLPLVAACNGIDVGFDDPDAVAPEAVWVEETLASLVPPAVDVLFIVDGTGSMAEEQAALAAASSSFVDNLSGQALDWQLGAASTDLGDGGVLTGDPWIITPAAESPAHALAVALTVGTDHVPPSAGLDAATLALRDSTGQNHGFRRQTAALHVVFVSDGDDQSGPVLGADPVDAFVDLLANEAARAGQPARASAVVGPASVGCEGGSGSASAGFRYLEVAARTGGASASICDADFTAVADAIGALAVERPVRFALQAQPVEGTLSVTVNGVRTTAFTLDRDGPAVVFTEAPGVDDELLARYQLAEEGE